MGRRVTVAVLAVAASLALASTAQAAMSIYYVEGVSDSALATCRPTTVAQQIQCDSLRAAVTVH